MAEDTTYVYEDNHVPIKSKLYLNLELKKWAIFLLALNLAVIVLVLMHMVEIMEVFLFGELLTLVLSISVVSYFIGENLFKTIFIHIKKYYVLIDSPQVPSYYAGRRLRRLSSRRRMKRIERNMKLVMQARAECSGQ